MNTAILIPFIVPTVVAVALTAMLIRERDYFFNYKRGHNKHDPENNNQAQKEKNLRTTPNTHGIYGEQLGEYK